MISKNTLKEILFTNEEFILKHARRTTVLFCLETFKLYYLVFQFPIGTDLS